MNSMFVTYSFCPQIPVKSTLFSDRIMVLKQVPRKKALKFQIKSSIRNKVFEDRSEGVICYIEENGEIVCEGYDEGPRFHRRIPKPSYQRRDSKIFDVLQQRLFQIVHGDESKNAGNGLISDSKRITGFNKF